MPMILKETNNFFTVKMQSQLVKIAVHIMQEIINFYEIRASNSKQHKYYLENNDFLRNTQSKYYAENSEVIRE